MKKTLLSLAFIIVVNVLVAQMPEQCELCLKRIVESSSHYKKRFGNKDIFSNKKWNGDASSDGSNLTYTIYRENTKVGTYNRIVTYHLNGTTKKLSVEDAFSKNNSDNISYDHKLLAPLYKFCLKGRYQLVALPIH